MDKLDRRAAREIKLAERCAVLAEVIQSVAPIYLASPITENQRQLIETMIGAAIWYLPQDDGLWTGKISIEGVRLYHPDHGVPRPKLTADHSFPRKVAAKELLNLSWLGTIEPAAELLRRYTEQYGRYNLITPTENRKLMKFQKTNSFVNSEDAYTSGGVKLLSISRDQLIAIKARDKRIIEDILPSSLVV